MTSSMGSLKEWLIAIALFVLLPTTVYLGCSLISPKIDYSAHYEARKDFFKGYDCKNREKCEKREQEWLKTDDFKNHEQKLCKRNVNYLLVAGPLSVALMYTGTFFVMPVIAASLIVTSLNMLMFYSYSYKQCVAIHGMRLFWFELLFVFLNLMLVILASYRVSEEQ